MIVVVVVIVIVIVFVVVVIIVVVVVAFASFLLICVGNVGSWFFCHSVVSFVEFVMYVFVVVG